MEILLQTSWWQNSCTLVCSHFGLSRAPLLHHLGWSSSPTSLSQHHNRALTAENLISVTSARFWCLNSSCQQTKEKMIFFFSADQRFSRRGWSQMCYSVVLKRPNKDTWGELYLLLFWLNYPLKLIQRSQQAQNTITHTPIKAEEQFPPPQIQKSRRHGLLLHGNLSQRVLQQWRPPGSLVSKRRDICSC